MNTTAIENSSVLTGVSTPKSTAKEHAVRIIELVSTDNVKSNGKQMIIFKVGLVNDASGKTINACFTAKYQKSLTGDILVDKDGHFVPVKGSKIPTEGDEVIMYATEYIAENGREKAWFEISRRDPNQMSEAEQLGLCR